MGSVCLFTRQRSVKMGYFYWLRVKNSNHLHTELSLREFSYVLCVHGSYARAYDAKTVRSRDAQCNTKELI